MRISKLLSVPSVRILLYMINKNNARYTDLAKLIISRGVLSSNLKALEKEDLLTRTVVSTKPIQTYYSLSVRGQKIAKCLSELNSCFTEEGS